MEVGAKQSQIKRGILLSMVVKAFEPIIKMSFKSRLLFQHLKQQKHINKGIINR